METGRRLILADGTTIEDGEAGQAAGFLWLYIPGLNMREVADTVLDEEKTAEIRFEYGEMADTYTGYTECRSINRDWDGRISVCMVKGE